VWVSVCALVCVCVCVRACVRACVYTHTYIYIHEYTLSTERRWRPRAIIDDSDGPLFQTPGSYTLAPRASTNSIQDMAQNIQRFGDVHGVVCIRPPAVCELASQLGVPSVVYVSERLERGRETDVAWREVLLAPY
jgi:hypothetical protein